LIPMVPDGLIEILGRNPLPDSVNLSNDIKSPPTRAL
jgi:hypothetical protein